MFLIPLSKFWTTRIPEINSKGTFTLLVMVHEHIKDLLFFSYLALATGCPNRAFEDWNLTPPFNPFYYYLWKPSILLPSIWPIPSSLTSAMDPKYLLKYK